MAHTVDIQSAASEASIAAQFAADELDTASDTDDPEHALEQIEAARSNLQAALDAISDLQN